MKVLMLVLVIATVSATVVALPKIPVTASSSLLALDFTPAIWFFVATLVGWMPAPLDAAVMQSLWTLEKSRDLEHALTWREASTDFHIGFFLTALIAVCFLLLGTAIMRGGGVELSESATGFSIQLVNMYEQVLGAWSRPMIALTTLAVMLSTVLVMLDGYSRSISTLVFQTLRIGRSEKGVAEQPSGRQIAGVMLLLNLGAMSVLIFFMRSFTTMLAIATTVSFVAAPLLAWLTHRAMVSDEVPAERRIGRGLQRYSLVCIAALTLFTLFYLYLAASQ
jgi:Mn2+/Fe2+ NRAMP family transporter